MKPFRSRSRPGAGGALDADDRSAHRPLRPRPHRSPDLGDRPLQLRCVVCKAEEGVTWVPRSEILTFEEIERIALVAYDLGVDSVRLTGGEPLVRASVTDLVARLGRIGFSDLSMTTNGSGLRTSRRRSPWRSRRVNISCDSLKPERFAGIRRRGVLGTVLEAMDAAEQAGLTPVKINVVVMAWVNDDEIVDLAGFAEYGPRRAVHRVHATVRQLSTPPPSSVTSWSAGTKLNCPPLRGLEGSNAPS